MNAPYFTSASALHLKGADAPNVWTTWHDDGTVSVLFDGGPNQYFGFCGTPQEVRLALAKGLAAVDRAVAELEAAERTELATADALEEPAEAAQRLLAASNPLPANRCEDCGGNLERRRVSEEGEILEGCVCVDPYGSPVWVGAT